MADLRCPICNEIVDIERSPAMPFCSRRCKQIDLGRWLDEEYGVPVEPEDEGNREIDLSNTDEEE